MWFLFLITPDHFDLIHQYVLFFFPLRDGNDDSLPDTQVAVQELLLSLFTSMYNHQDEEGRCFSDSLAELPEYDDVDGNK